MSAATEMNSGGRTYRIGEAAHILGLEPYVLRYWETEFSQLKPLRTSRGQRLYTEEHLLLLRRIKYLLYREGLTIAGAQQKLESQQQWCDLLQELRKEVLEIKSILHRRGSWEK